MRPLKIALLSHWYWAENRRAGTVAGGTAQQLAEAVAALGHEVVVLSQSPEAGPLEKSRIGALEVWLSPRDRKRDFLTGLREKWAKQTFQYRKVYSDALALRDFLAKRGPFDLLWAQCEEPDGLVAAVAAQMGVALPPTLTQIYALRYGFDQGKPVFNGKTALRLAFHHASQIVANSQLVADNLSHYADAELTASTLREKTRVLPHNLLLEFLEVAQGPIPPPEPGRVLFFGALNEKKGALIFLEALAKTHAAPNGATFAMTGGFTENHSVFAEQWKSAVEKVQTGPVSVKLELLGQVSSVEAIRQIQRASVVVLPSLFDEFSRALIEALILGRPVITTNQVGASPLVEAHQCGVVIPPNDSNALARAIDLALNPISLYAAHAQSVAHRMLHEFAPSAIAKQLCHYFSEMLEGSNRREN